VTGRSVAEGLNFPILSVKYAEVRRSLSLNVMDGWTDMETEWSVAWMDARADGQILGQSGR